MRLRLFGVGVLAAALVMTGGRPAVGDDEKRNADKAFDDKEFVQLAASGGQFEVKIGEVAKTKAANELVRNFGEKLVTDHTKANEKLMTIAKAVQIEGADKMNEKDQKEFDKLNGLSGAEFDKAFMEKQVKCHDEAVKMFKRATTEAKNAEVKQFATDTLPKLEEHLKHAKEIQGQLK